jgi:hypothetical protein
MFFVHRPKLEISRLDSLNATMAHFLLKTIRSWVNRKKLP